MRIAILLALAGCVHAVPPPATEPAAELSALKPLVGTWDGTDPDRQQRGTFTVQPELDGRVLVRRASNESPEGRHQDLTIFFNGPAGLRADYYDNEGHLIRYAVTAEAERIVLISDEGPGPRFRLTYELRDPATMLVDFAIAPPGSLEFRHYTGALVQRR
jgi:hypothetical protein